MRIADFFDNSESLWPLCVFIRIPANPPNRKLILSWRISRRRQAKKQSLTRCFTRGDCRLPLSEEQPRHFIGHLLCMFIVRAPEPIPGYPGVPAEPDPSPVPPPGPDPDPSPGPDVEPFPSPGPQPGMKQTTRSRLSIPSRT